MSVTNSFLGFVDRYLIAKEPKCYRHCEQLARFEPLHKEDSSLVGAYVCPENFVSRVVYFSDRPDPDWFVGLLREQAGSRFQRKDVRMATRHGWELGGKAEDEIKEISDSVKEYYWTMYARTDEEKKYGTFLCAKSDGGCGKLFNKLRSDSSKLCPNHQFFRLL